MNKTDYYESIPLLYLSFTFIIIIVYECNLLVVSYPSYFYLILYTAAVSALHIVAAGRLILVASRRLVALGAPFSWSIFITHVIKVLSHCIGFTRGRGPLIRPRIRL